MNFYFDTLRNLIAAGKLDAKARTLVVAGGSADRDALLAAGFTDVTISNLDTRMIADQFAPYAWSFQDAEALTYADNEFQQVIEHAGLHHCASPHRALTEMYRVASHAVLAFEARDSALLRFGKLFGLTSDHEVEAVVAHGYTFGGWRNTSLPNYVYRWNEREVTKVVASYDPTGPIPIDFFYGLRLPTERLSFGSRVKRVALNLLALPIRAVFVLAPRQGNEFAFFISKPKGRFPWIGEDQRLDREWLDQRYQVPESLQH